MLRGLGQRPTMATCCSFLYLLRKELKPGEARVGSFRAGGHSSPLTGPVGSEETDVCVNSQPVPSPAPPPSQGFGLCLHHPVAHRDIMTSVPAEGSNMSWLNL
jgi:hypothetical protein